MTATDLNSIRTGNTAHDAPRARRTHRPRPGASEDFRTLVAEFDARLRTGREQPADAPVRPRHVIAAEGILRRMGNTRQSTLLIRCSCEQEANIKTIVTSLGATVTPIKL